MKIQIIPAGFEVAPELEKYALDKLEHLEKQLPRQLRAVSVAELSFSQKVTGKQKHSTCELRLKIPREELTARETTQHIYAALDIAAASVEQQLKDLLTGQRRGLRGHVKRRLGL